MSTIPAYQFDAAGIFRGETTADESPLEPGVYLLPAGCTRVPPPAEVPEGRWPRWNGVAWELVNKPQAPAAPDPLAKLTAFLNENPDVAALIEQPATV
ncbi:phage tail protein [Stutzerimonas stutzeri]